MLFYVNILGENILELSNELLEIFGRKVGVVLDTLLQLKRSNGVLKQVGVDTHYDVREHLDEATI